MPSSKPRQRFRDIVDCIDAVQGYIDAAGGVDAAMHRSPVHRDAIERRLSIISEAAAKLDNLAERMEPAIRWDKVRGIGNYLRHNYDDLNEEILLDVVRNGLEPLRAACIRALAALPGDAS